VVKQADLVLAMQLRPDAFTAGQKARNFAYYEPLTVRDSSLSACTQAVMAAEIGQLDLAHDYLAEAALMDLADVEQDTWDGVHLASLAGAWLALVVGFGGMRAPASALSFSPRLPGGITKLRFRIRYRSRKLCVAITRGRAAYELLDGPPLQIAHHDQPFLLGATRAERDIPSVTAGPRPEQPPGRTPYRRSAQSLFGAGQYHGDLDSGARRFIAGTLPSVTSRSAWISMLVAPEELTSGFRPELSPVLNVDQLDPEACAKF
jgi:alpha,alpha-trehalose phosphorylase